MVKQDTNKNISIIKWISITALMIAIIITASFIAGTFYPNKWTTENIQKDFHKKHRITMEIGG